MIIVAMVTELADVNTPNSATSEETLIMYDIISLNDTFIIITTTQPVIVKEAMTAHLPYNIIVFGATISFIVICVVCIFTALIIVLIKKKLQKKKLKANISNRVQNIYSECPIAPIYEMVLRNFDHVAANGTGTLNVVFNESQSESNPVYTPSLAIDGTSRFIPKNEPVVIEITREITSVNINPHFQICPNHQCLQDTDLDYTSDSLPATPSVSSSSSSHNANDDFVYPSF